MTKPKSKQYCKICGKPVVMELNDKYHREWSHAETFIPTREPIQDWFDTEEQAKEFIKSKEDVYDCNIQPRKS